MTDETYVARVWHNGWSWCWSVDHKDAPYTPIWAHRARSERAAIRQANREKAKRARRAARIREERIV